MKHLVLSAFMLLAMIGSNEAQVKQKKEAVKKYPAQKSAQVKKYPGPLKNSKTVRLNSVSDHQAMSQSLRIQNTTVADPFVATLNARARGYTIDVKNVEILGMPKGAYGFAHGKLRVFPTGTTSSGTITGMGAVATGSSPGSMGGTGLGMGANGKSPYAGIGMWGNSRGLVITKGDSLVRRSDR